MKACFVGDVHGCLEELDELLYLLDCPGSDITFLGDLVDRGPDSLGVIRRVQEIYAKNIMGNHCLKYLKWDQKVATGTADDSTKSPQFLRTFQSIKNDMEWISQLPYYRKTVFLGKNRETVKEIYAVHGGFMPGVPIEQQKHRSMPYLRDIHEHNGKPVHYNGTVQPGTFHWSTRWDGPFTVYGHSVFEKPFRTQNALGIDTGCCFGGALTAFVIDCDTLEESFVTVPAKRLPAGVFKP